MAILRALLSFFCRLPFLQSIFDKLDNESRSRQTFGRRRSFVVLAKILTIAIVATIVGFIFSSLVAITRWPPPVYTNPAVYNLTRADHEWDVLYLPRDLCSDDTCAINEGMRDYPVTRRATLPIKEFPLEGFEKGHLVYYRTDLHLPEALLDSRSVLLFHSVYIWAKSFKVYVNSQLIDSGGQQLLNIPIPPFLLGDGHLQLEILVDPGDLPYQGISHFGDIVVGPRSLLSSLDHVARDIQTTFFLFHILPRIGICLVFALVFLTQARSVENFIFVLYGASSSLALFLASDLPSQVYFNDTDRALALIGLHLVSTWLFIVLMHCFFRRHNDHIKYITNASAVFLAGSVLYCGWMLNDAETLFFYTKVDYVCRVLGCIYALFTAVSTSLYLYSNKKSRYRLYSALAMASFMAFSIGFYLLSPWGFSPSAEGATSLYMHDSLLFLVLAAALALEYSQTVSQRDFIRMSLRKFVDSRVADRLMSEPRLLDPRKNKVTVMFCDIRAFTAISEAFPPDDVFSLLNSYFDTMVNEIDRYNGVVDKFTGDCIMAVWGIPTEIDDHAVSAARCAVAMRKALTDFNAKRQAEGLFPIAVGIGIYTGEVIAGAVGSVNRHDYTVIGDTVNTAARLESLSKTLQFDIVVGDSTWNLIKHCALAMPATKVSLRGKTDDLNVYTLVGVLSDDNSLECGSDFLAAKLQNHAQIGEILLPGLTHLDTYEYKAQDQKPEDLQKSA